ncbi:DNA polymerase beta domain protein region [Rippkaea orientalis PCC 8801]|uniref:DNA polymerase beta domain protein region n=1 Tax=Rippkaea orientalis (strain PCC 8801 / RF-1) TaxID=41431 RepID=B7JXT0_RIPO1|nr:nucleotidyltransferase [Rippkaea orientalis]ACK65894.1 DNA polymerase beta domain protein region [Rippkaea orientalis PCC 8801]
MNKDTVINIVKIHQETLKTLGVQSLKLFGSVARNEATETSDVDFLVEFNAPVGLFGLFRVKHYLEDILGCSVDLGTVQALKEHLRETVLKESIHVI